MLNREQKKRMIKIALFKEVAAIPAITGKGIIGITPHAVNLGIGVSKIPFRVAKRVAKGGYRAAKNEAEYLSRTGDTSPILTGAVLGYGASKAYRSYNDPSGIIGRTRNAYLRSRYLPNGYLNRIARGIDSINLAVHSVLGRPNFNTTGF